MVKIDFNKEKCAFDNGTCKWYIDKHFQNYIENEQKINLPKLKGYGCFIVKGKDIEDYVLIDHKQNIIASYHYNGEGYGQMEAMINIMKVSKHYDDCEKV